jgi:hypothetical protein
MLDELLRNSCGRYYGRDMAESGHDANERRSTLLTQSVMRHGSAIPTSVVRKGTPDPSR